MRREGDVLTRLRELTLERERCWRALDKLTKENKYNSRDAKELRIRLRIVSSQLTLLLWVLGEDV